MKQSAVSAIVLLWLVAPAAAQPASPTFTKDVAPIVFANCTNCDGPFHVHTELADPIVGRWSTD